ncbi:MAG: TolC family protein [Candidatus Aminicenantes bacterium]|nr:TolC family protein [Candidatus Aminicenantes bacterium]
MKHHTIKYLIFFAAAGFLYLPGIPSQEPAPAELTLDQCIEISLVRNPLWLASEQDIRASLARIEKARAIPQPSLDFDSDLQPRLLDFGGSGESYFGLSQTVEFPGRRALRTKIARLESAEASADRSILRAEIIFQIKEAFYSVLLAEEKRKYAVQDLDLARDFLQKAKVKFEAGDVARVEIVRAGVEESKAATALAVAENQIHLEKARLNYLLGRQKAEPLSVRGDLVRARMEFDLENLILKAMTARPEMAGMKARIDRGAAMKKEAGLSYLPDFDLGVARHRIDGEKTTWDFTLSLPLPLFFWQPMRGDIAEAEAGLLSLRHQAQQLANTIRLEVEQSGLQAQSAAGQISLFQDQILKQAQEVYDLFLYSFQEGEITGIELIEARRTLIESLKSYADALYVYNMALASLEKSVGEPLHGGQSE